MDHYSILEPAPFIEDGIYWANACKVHGFGNDYYAARQCQIVTGYELRVNFWDGCAVVVDIPGGA